MRYLIPLWLLMLAGCPSSDRIVDPPQGYVLKERKLLESHQDDLRKRHEQLLQALSKLEDAIWQSRKAVEGRRWTDATEATDDAQAAWDAANSAAWRIEELSYVDLTHP